MPRPLVGASVVRSLARRTVYVYLGSEKDPGFQPREALAKEI
jgi:hypothetical protein